VTRKLFISVLTVFAGATAFLGGLSYVPRGISFTRNRVSIAGLTYEWKQWTWGTPEDPSFGFFASRGQFVLSRSYNDDAVAPLAFRASQFGPVRIVHFAGRGVCGGSFSDDERIGLATRPLPPPRFVETNLQVPAWLPAPIFAAYPVVAFIIGPMRRWRRRMQGQCLACGYNLTGNVSGVCPECGTAKPAER